MSEIAEFCYKCTDFYHPGDEGGLAWNDPEIGIEWPTLTGEYKKEQLPVKDMHLKRNCAELKRKRSALGWIKRYIPFLNRHAFGRSCQWQVL